MTKPNNIDNIFNNIGNNSDFNEMIGTLFKTINNNLKQNINDDKLKSDSDTDSELESEINNTEMINNTEINDCETSPSNFMNNNKEIDIDIDFDSINDKNLPNNSSLEDILLYLFVDKHGNNIADVLSELSFNIAESNKLKFDNLKNENENLN